MYNFHQVIDLLFYFFHYYYDTYNSLPWSSYIFYFVSFDYIFSYLVEMIQTQSHC